MRGEDLGGTKVMFWMCPEAGLPPGLVPVGPQGALPGRCRGPAAGGGGLSLGLLREMAGSPGAAKLRMGAKLLWDTSSNWRSFCMCTEVDPEAQLIVSFNARSE